MSCTTLKNLLDAAVSPADIDRLVADFGYRSHLDACPSCRAEFAAARQLLDFFARQKASAATVPEQEVQSTRAAILRAVAEREHRASHAFFPTWLSDPLLAGGLAFAAFVIIVFGIVEYRRGTAEVSQRVAATALVRAWPPSVPQKPAPPATPRAAPATLASLREEFERQKASDTGVGHDLAKRLRAFMAKDARGADERVDTAKLLVVVLEQSGEADSARAAFGTYLDCVEQRDGLERAESVAYRKAEGIFYGQRDYLQGLAYYDLMLARYPEGRRADEARYMVCRYYELTGELSAALEAYRALGEQEKGTPVGRRTDEKIVTVLYNMGKREEAYAKLQEDASKYPQEAGWIHFRTGMLMKAEGRPRYAEAVRQFQIVIEKYPQSTYVPDAKRFLADMRRDIVNDMTMDSPGKVL